eukprot:8544650-Pyramimonas_sp.AAC.1
MAQTLDDGVTMGYFAKGKVYSHNAPIVRRERGYIPIMDQSETPGLWGVECILAVIGTGGPVK